MTSLDQIWSAQPASTMSYGRGSKGLLGSIGRKFVTDADHRLIVAKSFSSLCIPWAEEADIPGIWLTPLLTDDRVRSTIGTSSKDDLFIGGSLDKLWDGGRKSEGAGAFVEVPGADHSLQIPNDWRASQKAQAEVFARVEAFAAGLS
ncbi:hypothetical protein [Paenarthrobacter nitroguajacolicus]